ncbi:RlmE family RNA methyltransferase [Polynucleobacter meluiroseus]|uniref:RlmE family RNA methyltransferase n=1 Tax=Polynucleobacter meluiroseus TaxID=1938814 RepID=UPI000BBC5167|nr:RlmE family RNA methyltransferase [Polynucleobacter meluiroseus]
MAKNKFNKSWLQDHLNDPYVKMAQKEGYRARAVYKLSEIDEQDHLIKAGMTIVDLGSTPGSWSQYARNRLTELGKNNPLVESGKPDGVIIAIDILPMEDIADVHFIQGDFREDEGLQALEAILADKGGHQVDLVLSDMAPNLSGVGVADAARMAFLAEIALDFSLKHLKPEGALLIKCFNGSGYSQIVETFKKSFKTVVSRKPKASRAKSSEIFLLGRNFKSPK